MLRPGMQLVGLMFALAGCSFFFVHGPPPEYVPATVQCSDGDVIPSVDATLGVLGIAGAVGGEFITRLSDSYRTDHYELYYGLPLTLVGIIYLVAASHGTDKVQACRVAKHGESAGCDGCAEGTP